jgi:hypothetical protein
VQGSTQTFGKTNKAGEKKVQALRAKVEAQTERKLRHTQKVERLEDSLRQAAEVCVHPNIQRAFLLSKISFAFMLSSLLTRKV